MLTRVAIKLLLWLLPRAEFTQKDRALCTGLLLRNLGALPIRDIILYDEKKQQLLVDGSPLKANEAATIMEISRNILDNSLMNKIWNQIKYECLKRGVSEGNNPDSIMFYRAAIWFGEQERNWLRMFAGDDIDGNLTL